MKASSYLAAMLRRVAVSRDGMAQASRLVSAAGIKDEKTVDRLLREWVNDAVAFQELAPAEGAADGAFLAWLSDRLADPFRVSPRAVVAARARHGHDAALIFQRVRWRQEVAWAHRMRADDNDRVAFLASFWLQAARRDPSRLFGEIVDVFASSGVTDASYAESPLHMLSEEEIRDGVGDAGGWRPLWLRFAEAQFARVIAGTHPRNVAAFAATGREAEVAECVARRRAAAVAHLKAWRPVHVVPVLEAAAAAGLSSDDLVAAEQAFLKDVEQGSEGLDGRPSPWRILAARLPRWSGTAPAPTPLEADDRRAAVEALPPDWANGLPVDIASLDGGSHANVMAWFDDISTGRRTPPVDPVVDYALWLCEERRG